MQQQLLILNMQGNVGYFDNLETDSWNITNSVTFSTKAIQATIIRNKCCYFLAIFDQLDSDTFPDGRIRLLSLYTDDALGVGCAPEGVGLQRGAQVRLLVLLVMPLLVAPVVAELAGRAQPPALAYDTERTLRGRPAPPAPPSPPRTEPSPGGRGTPRGRARPERVACRGPRQEPQPRSCRPHPSAHPSCRVPS
uniref:Uncharacterized protein n=1 Tax=Crocodylus porosus TaxID=8502 RepID=A0A7M4FRW0_CROPO